jgi:hypothetical protein
MSKIKFAVAAVVVAINRRSIRFHGRCFEQCQAGKDQGLCAGAAPTLDASCATEPSMGTGLESSHLS